MYRNFRQEFWFSLNSLKDKQKDYTDIKTDLSFEINEN